MFLRFFGRNRDPATLSQRDWDRFICERRAGRIGPSGRVVSDRTVEYDLKFLIAVLNRAARSRDERGRPLLDRNPLKGFRKPTERNPTRVVLTEDEYQALLKVARRVDWRSTPFRTRDFVRRAGRSAVLPGARAPSIRCQHSIHRRRTPGHFPITFGTGLPCRPKTT